MAECADTARIYLDKPIDPDAILSSQPTRIMTVAEMHARMTDLEGVHERNLLNAGPGEYRFRQSYPGPVQFGIAYCNTWTRLKFKRAQHAPVLLQFPLTRPLHLQVDNQEIVAHPGEGVVIGPGHVYQRESEPAWIIAVRIEMELLRSRLLLRHKRLSSKLLSFSTLIPRESKEILNYTLLFIEAIDRGHAMANNRLGKVMSGGLVDLLLELQPNNYLLGVGLEERKEKTKRIQLVEEFIKNNITRKISTDQLAKAADCSVRTLQETFAEICRLSPKRFLLQQRLAMAREMLEFPDQKTNITEVAKKVGFSHTGRFASAYHDFYGEFPSDTLARC